MNNAIIGLALLTIVTAIYRCSRTASAIRRYPLSDSNLILICELRRFLCAVLIGWSAWFILTLVNA